MSRDARDRERERVRESRSEDDGVRLCDGDARRVGVYRESLRERERYRVTARVREGDGRVRMSRGEILRRRTPGKRVADGVGVSVTGVFSRCACHHRRHRRRCRRADGCGVSCLLRLGVVGSRMLGCAWYRSGAAYRCRAALSRTMRSPCSTGRTRRCRCSAI